MAEILLILDCLPLPWLSPAAGIARASQIEPSPPLSHQKVYHANLNESEPSVQVLIESACSVVAKFRRQAYRLATVRATNMSISLTLPRWKNPKLDRSAARPKSMGSRSPLCFLRMATAVSFMVESKRCVFFCAKNFGVLLLWECWK